MDLSGFRAPRLSLQPGSPTTAVVEYLARLKWPESFRCVHCSE